MNILSVVMLLGSLMMVFNPSAGLALEPGAIEFDAIIKPDEQCCPALDNQCATNPRKKKAVCNLADSQFKRCVNVKLCVEDDGGDKPCIPACRRAGFTQEECNQQCGRPPTL